MDSAATANLRDGPDATRLPPSAAVAAPIRVLVQQPALPRYRVPVFRELARRDGIDLEVAYGDVEGLKNAAPDGFRATHTPVRTFRVAGQPFFWHGPQWRGAATEAEAADVLVLSWNLRFASLLPALLRAKASGVASILWGHGYAKQDSAWRSWLRRQVTRLATATLFYNHTTARRFIAAGADPRRVFVALNAIDEGPVRRARADWLGRPERLAAFRAEHGLADGPVLLFVSRLTPKARIDLLVEAAATLRKEFPGLRVVIVGDGDATALRAQADRLGIADAVAFPGPVYEENALAAYFLAADLYCYPSHVGLSLIQAFAYGLPVVTDDRIDLQNPEIEALRSGENGALYRHGDAADLAAVLARLLRDPADLARMADAALRTVGEAFSLKNMVDGLEQAIRFCAAQRPRRNLPREAAASVREVSS